MSAIKENSHNASTEDSKMESTERFLNNIPVIEHEVVECPSQKTESLSESVSTEVDIKECVDPEVDIKKNNEVLVGIQKGEINQEPEDKNAKVLDITDCSTEMKPSSESTVTDIQKVDIDNPDCSIDIKPSSFESENSVVTQKVDIDNPDCSIDMKPSSFESESSVVIQKVDIDNPDCSIDMKPSSFESESSVVIQKVDINNPDCSIDMKPSSFESESSVVIQKVDINNPDCSIDMKPSSFESESLVVIQKVDFDIQNSKSNEIPQMNITECSIDIKQISSENTNIKDDIQKDDTNQGFQDNRNEKLLKISEGLIDKNQIFTENKNIVDIEKGEINQGTQDKNAKVLDIADCSTEMKPSSSECESTMVDVQKCNINEDSQINITKCSTKLKPSSRENTDIEDDIQKSNTNQGFQGNNHVKELKITEGLIEKKQTSTDSEDIVDINQADSSEQIKKENLVEKSSSCEDQEIPAKENLSDVCFLCNESGHKQTKCPKKTQKKEVTEAQVEENLSLTESENLDIANCSTDIKLPISENESTVIIKQKENTEELDISNSSTDIKPSLSNSESTVIDKQKEDMVDIEKGEINQGPQDKNDKILDIANQNDCSTEILQSTTENENIVDIEKGEIIQGPQDKNAKVLDIADCSTEMKPSSSENESTVVDVQKSNTNEVPQVDNVDINEKVFSEHIKKDNIQEESPSCDDQEIAAKKKRTDICFICRESGHKKSKCPKITQNQEVTECQVEKKLTENEELDIANCSSDIKPPLSENESTVFDIQEESPSCEDQETPAKKNRTDICFICRESGHKKSKCPKKKQNQEITECQVEKTLTENEELHVADCPTDIKPPLSENARMVTDIQNESSSCEDQETPAKKRRTDICFICRESGHKKSKCPKKKQTKELTETLTENKDTFQVIPKVEINQETHNKCMRNDMITVDTELNVPEKTQSVTKSENTITDKSDNNECKNESQAFKSQHLDDVQKDDASQKSQASHDSKSSIPNQVEKKDSKLCYHCQTPGHKQNACPQKNKRHASVEPGGPASKKVKSANCYLCGESGHKKTKCPKKQEIEAGNMQQWDGNKNATEEDDDAKSDNTSDSKTLPDSQPEWFFGLNPGRRLLLKKLPKSWTAKDVTHFLQDKCVAITTDLKKVVMIKEKKDKCWGLEFGSPNACLEARTLLHQIGSIDGQKFVCTLAKDPSIAFSGRITVNTFIRTRQFETPFPAFSHDLLLNHKIKQRQEETFGLNKDFLNHLNITLPLTTKIFVKNLSKEVTEHKLREVFEIAGNVVSVKLDESLPTAIIEFQHPVDAVQAISMLNNQELFGQKMEVRQDKYTNVSPLLPTGLSGVGMGLGQDGRPLRNIWDLMEVTTVKQKLTEIESQLSALEQKFKKHDSIVKANTPQTLIKVPQKKTNVPQTQTNVPQNKTNVPQTQTNVPLNKTNVPQKKMNVPQKQMNMPQKQMNVSQNQANVPQHYMNVPQHHMNMQPMSMPPPNQITLPPQNQITMPPPNQMTIPPPNQMTIPPPNQITIPQPNQIAMPPQNQITMPPQNQITMPPQNQMTMPPYPMQQTHVSAPQHPASVPQMHMVDPLYQMNMQQHQMNMLANSMDMMAQYQNVMAQSYTDVSQSQMNVIPHETPQYYVNMPQNTAEVPTLPYVNVPQNKASLPQVPHVDLKKIEIPNMPVQSVTQPTDPKKPNPVQSKTVTQSKAPSQSELQQMKAVREFLATIRSKERESPEISDPIKRGKYSPSSVSKGRHSYSPSKMSISSEEDSDGPPPPTISSSKKRRSTSRSKERRSYGESSSSHKSSKYSKDNVDRRREWKTTEDRIPVVQSDKLLFTNLPKSVTAKALESKMCELGELRWVDFIRTGRAIVRFKDIRDAARCIKLYNGSKVDGQTIHVTYDSIS